jgi:hypothetical protein
MAYEELGTPDNFLFMAAVELGYSENILFATETYINWKENFNLTEEQQIELVAKKQELRAEYDKKEYQGKRASEYAPLAEQLDMQYHDVQDGTETWLNHIREVKAKYPKDSE